MGRKMGHKNGGDTLKSLDKITTNYKPIIEKFIGFKEISKLNFKRNIGIMEMNVWRINNPGWHLMMGLS